MKYKPNKTYQTMKKTLLTLALAAFAVSGALASEWAPAGNRLMTRWGKEVTPENAWREYPRPQMVRQQWQNLNGLWEYAVTSQQVKRAPTTYQGQILVPFAIESALSGVGKRFNPTDQLWYRTEFTIDAGWKGQDILLHFGAVDYHSTVWVNDVLVGSHKGGYDAFSFDITPYLKEGGKQRLVVAVTDPTEEGDQARGKQQIKTGRIWYTPVSGIWQTVWLEPVSRNHIEKVVPLADIDQKRIQLQTTLSGAEKGDRIAVNVYDPAGRKIESREFAANAEIAFPVPEMQLWSPSAPNLYTFDMTLKSGDRVVDRISSYFAMRKIAAQKDPYGTMRMYLNNEFLFQMGTLDQGWWPDGLCTPPSVDAMKYDMEVLKSLGLNTLRKHIKVEPALYYYYADKLGLLIWQDMPSGFKLSEKAEAHVRQGREKDWKRPVESAKQWETELKAMIDGLRFFPSIICWGVFNEGWGQYDTKAVIDRVVNYDKSRLVDGVSGWVDRNAGPMFDIHNYPNTAMCPRELIGNRVQVIGEFGGLGLRVDGHLWNPKMQNWGYADMKGPDDLARDYAKLMFDLEPLVMKGLSGAIYTQTTDVEGEINGLITYDREVVKLPFDVARRAHARLYALKPAQPVMLTGDSRIGKAPTTYSLTRRDKATEFIPGELPLPVNRNQTITARSTFHLDSIPRVLSLFIGGLGHHFVWINGVQVGSYQKINYGKDSSKLNHFNLSDHLKELAVGENVIEVQTGSGPNFEGEFTFALYAY